MEAVAEVVDGRVVQADRHQKDGGASRGNSSSTAVARRAAAVAAAVLQQRRRQQWEGFDLLSESLV